MAETKFLKCSCEHCGGRIEFPADGIGRVIPCPHCGKPTELALEIPAALTARQTTRSYKWFIAGGIILLVGAVAIAAILITTNRMMSKARQRNEALRRSVLPALPTNTAPENTAALRFEKLPDEFAATPVRLEKAAGSSLIHAIGTLRNESDRQRLGVTVELELLDTAGAVLGRAQDYVATVEPRSEWRFRALIVPKGVASARIVKVTEQQ